MHHTSAQVSPRPGTIAAYTFTVFEAFKDRPSCVRSRDGDIKGKVGKGLATCASSTDENDNEEQRQVRREPWFLHLIFVRYRTDTIRKMCLDGEVYIDESRALSTAGYAHLTYILLRHAIAALSANQRGWFSCSGARFWRTLCHIRDPYLRYYAVLQTKSSTWHFRVSGK